MEENLEQIPKNKITDKFINFYNSHMISFYLISFVIIFLSIYLIHKAYYELSINKYFLQKKITTTEKNSEYKKILYEQKNKKNLTEAKEEIKSRKADKKYKINFVLVRPKNLNEAKLTPLIENLKNPNNTKFKDCKYSNCNEIISLNNLNEFYKKQEKNYKQDKFALNINFSKLYEIEDLNKVGDFAYVWGKDPFAVANLTDNFEKIIKINKLDPEELYVFLYFDDSFEVGADSREGSFYEAKKFRSFADDEKGRAYINVYDLNPKMSSKITEIAAHEILHLFGASDKYTEDINDPEYCADNGRGEPDKRPLFPQTKADIMCLFVEYQPGKYKRGKFLDNEIVINNFTAEEIGWKN